MSRPSLPVPSRLVPGVGMCLLLAASVLVGRPPGVSAQAGVGVLRGSPAELSTTPEDAARAFLRSVRAIRWDVAGRFLHPATSERFALVVQYISDPDSTGRVRDYLVGTDSAGLAAMPPPEVFARAVEATVSDMPGLMHAVFDRDDAVVGHVAEGTDSAHVVYRTTARISGATPEVKVMQLARTPDGWRVLWSDELEVLEAALSGVPRMARGGPPRR